MRCRVCGGAGWVWVQGADGEAEKDLCWKCNGTTVADDLPVLPYAGTSGHGGNGPSRERAEREDASGVTTQRQREVMEFLTEVGEYGATWKELGEALGWHAGQSSGALSVLHKEGFVARLKNKRQRCSVYVMPWLVHGREESPHGSHRKCVCPNCGTEF